MNGRLFTILTLLLFIEKKYAGHTSTQSFDCSIFDCESVTCNAGSECTIDCRNGGCDEVQITSNNAYEVTVQCQSGDKCKESEIQIEGSTQRDVVVNCSYSYACSEAEISINMDNVGDDIEVYCSGATDACYKAEIDITVTGYVGDGDPTDNDNEVLVWCDEDYACMEADIDINVAHVEDDIRIHCWGYKSCKKAEIKIKAGNVDDDIKVYCKYSDSACEEAKVEVEVSGNVGDNAFIECSEADNVCKKAEISFKVDGTVGENTNEGLPDGVFGIACGIGDSLCEEVEFSGSAGKVGNLSVGCVGYEACKKAEISIETGEVFSGVDIECLYQSACKDAEIEVKVGPVGKDGIIVNCSNPLFPPGTGACENAKISLETTDSTDTVAVFCGGGADMCANAEFDFDNVAGGVDIGCGYSYDRRRMLLQTDNECENAEIKCGEGDCKLYCRTASSCEGVEVDAGDASSYQCQGECSGVSVDGDGGNGGDGDDDDDDDDSGDGSDSSDENAFANANALFEDGTETETDTESGYTAQSQEHISIVLSAQTLAHLWAFVGVVLLFSVGMCVCISRKGKN